MNCPRCDTKVRLIEEMMFKQVFFCDECKMKITCEKTI